MARRTSAGLLLYRKRADVLEVLLVHPGGPLWQGKDDGAWSIPKGEHDADEAPLDAARREFTEETGLQPAGPFLELAPVTLRSGKLVRAWAVAGDCDPTALRSNTFRMEWPPHSGRIAEFPEVDRAAFFSLTTARHKVNPGQVPLLDDLQSKLDAGPQRGHLGLPFTCWLVALVLSGCGDEGPTHLPESPAWRKFAGNPVLAGGDLGGWDAEGVSSPCVLRMAPDSLMMWYTGRDGGKSRIGLATSRDGLSWIKHGASPVLDTGAVGTWEELGVEHPNVRFDGTLLTMYYTGTGTGTSSSGIGLVTSTDGIHWSRSAANPVLPAGSPGSWDDTRVFMPWVLVAGNDHSMWYTGRGRYLAIGYASSDDGLLWNRLMTPVLHPEVLEAATFAPCVLAGDGLYRIWYGAIHETTGGGAQPAAIDYAQSFDGIDWTGNRHVLGPGDAGSWDARALKGCYVLQEGSLLRMWFTGESSFMVGDATLIVSAIGIATFE